MIFGAIEIAMLILFSLALVDALRHFQNNRHKILLLILAFIYALIFENVNIAISTGDIGSYVYNVGFNLFIWKTPLFVALAWSVLIYTSMQLTDMIKLKTLTRPFLDALLVVIIDLTLDVVAERQGLWAWIGYGATDGWFGVPANNFIGWMFVTFIFSFLFRYFTRTDNDMINKATRTEFYLLLPAFAYLAMLVMFSLVNLAESLFGLTKSEEIFILWAIVILFASMLRWAKHKPVHIFQIDKYTLFLIIFTRLLFYAYIVISIAYMRVYAETLAIILILILSIAAEVLVYQAAFGKWGVHEVKTELDHL